MLVHSARNHPARSLTKKITATARGGVPCTFTNLLPYQSGTFKGMDTHLAAPHAPHVEHHFTSSEVVRDAVIGMSDGLTVPFALAAGLSGAVDSLGIIVTASLAEIAAGSIAMGLGGYLGAKSEADHYVSEMAREQREIIEKPEAEKAEVAEVLESFGLTPDESSIVVARLQERPAAWLNFMMRFELGLEQPDPRRALQSAVTIASGYILGGFIPLSPYLFAPSVSAALPISVVLTLAALLIFGYIKGRYTSTRPVRSSLETVLVGGLAATAAFLLARALS